MPDITMCTNKECPLSHSCYRFNCEPNQYSQSYAEFSPKSDDELDEIECDYYIEP